METVRYSLRTVDSDGLWRESSDEAITATSKRDETETKDTQSHMITFFWKHAGLVSIHFGNCSIHFIIHRSYWKWWRSNDEWLEYFGLGPLFVAAWFPSWFLEDERKSREMQHDAVDLAYKTGKVVIANLLPDGSYEVKTED